MEHAPVISATQEDEAGNCLNPGGGGCSELRLCHCTPAWVTKQDSVKKKEKELTLPDFKTFCKATVMKTLLLALG